MEQTTFETSRWAVVPAALVAASAFMLFGLENDFGYIPMVLGLAVAFAFGKEFTKDLFLIGLGLGIVSTISVKADISWGNIALMGFVLAAAVAVPYAISRWGFKDHAVRFPVRRGTPWSRLEKSWLLIVVVLAYLILPFYFITSGVYQNWPAVQTPSEIGRLFVGVNAVGIWDELFFVCTIFALLRRHFNFWTSNILMAAIFVSFLWELGYQSWGPFLTIPFALVQGWIFTKTKSLTYVVCVHLLFDLFVFLTIVHAHFPEALPIFIY